MEGTEKYKVGIFSYDHSDLKIKGNILIEGDFNECYTVFTSTKNTTNLSQETECLQLLVKDCSKEEETWRIYEEYIIPQRASY